MDSGESSFVEVVGVSIYFWLTIEVVVGSRFKDTRDGVVSASND